MSPLLHELASRTVVSDCLPSSLGGGRACDCEPGDAGSTPAGALTPIYRGPGLVLGTTRRTICARDAHGFRIEIEDVGAFWVAADGRSVLSSGVEPGADRASCEETALGPPLMLALALQGVFTLHASAVQVGDGCVLFTAASGHGKSTLARLLDQSPGGLRRTADDIVAIVSDDGDLRAFFDLPQPKLSPADQARAGAVASLPVSAILALTGSGRDHLEASRVDPTAATVELLAATVAARLFDARLRRRHLEWCGTLAERLPIWRLAYPWTGCIGQDLTDLISEVAEVGNCAHTLQSRLPATIYEGRYRAHDPHPTEPTEGPQHECDEE